MIIAVERLNVEPFKISSENDEKLLQNQNYVIIRMMAGWDEHNIVTIKIYIRITNSNHRGSLEQGRHFRFSLGGGGKALEKKNSSNAPPIFSPWIWPIIF